MATLDQFLSEQAKLLAEAKTALDGARKKPPSLATALDAEEATLTELKSRAAELLKAKTETVRQFDEQLAQVQSEIASLEKQIGEDGRRM